MPIEREGADPLNGGYVAGIPPHMVGAAESPYCLNTDPADPYGMTTRQASSFYTGATLNSFSASALTTGDVYVNNINGRVYVRLSSALYWAAKDGGFSSISLSAGSVASAITGATRFGAAMLNGNTVAGASAPLTVLVTDATRPWIFNETTAFATAASISSTGMFCEWAEAYANRVFIGGRTDGWFGNYVTHSALNDPTDWNTANNAGAFHVGNVSKVTNAKATRNGLYFFSRHSIWLLTGTSPFDFDISLVTDKIGMVAPRGCVSDGQGVYVASDDGIYYVNGMTVTRISDKVREAYLAIPDKEKIALGYKGEKLYCVHNSTGTSANDSMLTAAPRRKLESGDVQPIWAKWSSTTYGGLTTGGVHNDILGVTVNSTLFVFRVETASVTNASATMTYRSPHWDFRSPEVKKVAEGFNIHVRPSNATQTWTAQWMVNGASAGSSYTITVASGASHALAGRKAVTAVTGQYLQLELSAVGQVTLYGVNAYAEVTNEGDVPRYFE